jgi:xanthine dehydrogenase molybdenum-binding subunit
MEEKRVIGINTPRKDGVAKVTGAMEYSSDVILPNMLYGALVRSPHAHAEIVSIDTSEAEAMGAVVLTRDDIHPLVYNERSVSIPAATYRDRTVLPLDKARHFGEPLCAVAAKTEELAHKAAAAIKITYNVLPALLTAEQAMAEGAPKIFEKIYLDQEEVFPQRNIGVIRNIDEGEVDKAFAEADKIYEDTFTLERIYHSQLETKSAVCRPESDGGITVWSTTQTIHGTRQMLGQILQLPLSKINIKKCAIGGGFGSSIQMNTVVPICACLAMKARKPVKLISSREEDFYSHHKYPTTFQVKLALKGELLSGIEIKALIDFGAHQIQPLAYMGCVAGWGASLYKYDGNIRFLGTAVYTNKVPCCAMQGYGNPQINFAIESMVDKICVDKGWDAIDFRLKNYRGIGDEFWGQGPTIRSIIKSSGVEESLVEGRKVFKWDERLPHTEKTGDIRYGIGVARGFHTSGTAGPKEGEVIDYSSALVKVNEDGSVDLVTPVADHGGGTWDALAKITADTLQVPLEKIGLSLADTTNTGFDIATHATRGIYCGGAAVYHVASKVREKILEFAGRILLEHPKELSIVRDDELGQGVVFTKHYPAKKITIGQVAKHAQINSWGTMMFADSYRQKNCPPCFVTHFIEVAVNTKTGEITIPRVLIYGDGGTVMNPDLFKGQLVGAFNRGLGYVLYEDLPYKENGQLENKGLFVDYKMPGPWEMPYNANMDVRICHVYEPSGPFGAKGIGEAALASVSAAITNAIYNAIGIRFTHLPVRPEKVMEALKEKAAGKAWE